jgi:hypothetical protein
MKTLAKANRKQKPRRVPLLICPPHMADLSHIVDSSAGNTVNGTINKRYFIKAETLE